MKLCSKCKQLKSLDFFSKCKSNKDGLQYHCKPCSKAVTINYKIKNSINYTPPSTKKCPVCKNIKTFQEFNIHKSNKDGLSSSCKFCISKTAKLRYQKNKDKYKKQQSQYYHNNKHIKNKYYNNKIKTDINFNIKVRLRHRLKKALKNNQKTGSAITELGCSIEYFKQYLESKFTEGMTWQLVLDGKIHIDHIIPLNVFNLTNKDEFKRACHYTNLQPLWAEDNVSKGSSLELLFKDFNNTPGVKVNVINTQEHVNNDKRTLLNNIDNTEGRLFQFYDFEVKNKLQQITGFLQSAIGKNTNKVYARKCELKEVDRYDAINFLNKYHILGGKVQIFMALGLYYNKELLCLATFGPHHRDRSKKVLNRFVGKPGWNVCGGLSKLSTHASKILGTIYTWIDLRMSNGSNWLKAGWIKEEQLRPDYFYYNPITKEIIKKQARKKALVNTPKNMTENEHAKKDGLLQIYDAGKLRLKFIYK